MSSVLEINNMSKIYGEADNRVKALDDVSFSIKQGEFVLIVGSSGSGKSTLLNMIWLLDPELPTIRTNSPCLIENETSSRAFTRLSASP